MKVIDKFEGEYAFLSNFYPCTIYILGIDYPTLEHAFQSHKTFNPLSKAAIRKAETPGKAKRLGGKVVLKENWESIKQPLMYILLRQKFSIPELKEKLLTTGDTELIEGNNWNDTYWGMCNGIGENHLGKLLMQVREELRNG
jgi:N-glycosidase YbiA